ncbi:hypothetical protein S58_43780 [Bradyrhizobium oligotrophicum S58]|uniref:Uncharacterized protein n=1 Tax=Bradyrhizobium oligotrophicum S58 TaxID=1245469 RepID=M4Z9E0_9BRAD|nr:hypothetical protein [Bradyrhizobium oligotrophicum]BAM90363.1 hypothetical protein S58_43780 [Bradyrhizobium oligotrophicum S58]
MENTMSTTANELLLELLSAGIDAVGVHCRPPGDDEPDDGDDAPDEPPSDPKEPSKSACVNRAGNC